MVGLLSSWPKILLGSSFGCGASKKSLRLSRNSELLCKQPRGRLAGMLVSGLMPTCGRALDIAVCQCSSLAVVMASSPPKTAGIKAGPVVPEVCLALPKSRRGKYRGGGGYGDGDDDGDDGGNYYNGWGGNWGGDEEDDARKWAVMWSLLCAYSAVQTLYFLLFGKEKKAGGPILATITCSLCSRMQEKYLKGAGSGTST